MSHVAVRERLQQEEDSLGAKASPPKLEHLGDKSLSRLHQSGPVDRTVHANPTEVTLRVEPRSRGPKHLALLHPECLKHSWQRSASVLGPGSRLVRIHGQADLP